MASTYTTNLRLTKQGDGENPNSWGQILNDGVISLADQAIAGYAEVCIGTTVSLPLTANDGSSDQSRNAFLEITGSVGGTHNTINVVIPNKSKSYCVLNNVTYTDTTDTVILKVTGHAGVTLERSNYGAGATTFQHVICDGASVRSANLLANNVTIADNLVVGGNTAITGTCTVTGAGQFKSTVTVSGAAHFKGAVSIGGALTGVDLMPAGAIVPYAGTTAPTGYLLAYGQSLERAGTYADLFSAIGTTYGSADSSHFNVPDLRGRAIAGQDDMGGSSADRLTGLTGGVDGDTLGAGGGVEAVSITEANLAAHAHLIAADAEGSGTYPTASNYIAKKGVWGSSNNYQFSGTATTPTLGLTTSVGSGTAHNNVQPTLILNYIIKF
jgi:microcystin-dependent protein|tara:strand:- start:829 stop:1980 length:1152 start_codon:yes stop_codon:yes gene_type:complete